MKFRVTAALALLVTSPLAHAADLGECVNISDDVVRLFCYDRAVGRQAAQTAPAPATAPTEPISAPPAIEAEVEVEKKDAAPKPKPEPKPESNAKSKNRVEARIAGKFEGWSKGTRFKLDNGQTWEAVGAGTHYSVSDSPAVVIERDFVGQNLMSVQGIKARAIVRRVDEP